MRKSQAGVMLIEALVAILIFSVGVIAVMGMQAVSIEQVSQAKYRTDASNLADQAAALLWLENPTNFSGYATAGYSGRAAWDSTVAATLPNGSGTIIFSPFVGPTGTTGGLFTITVNWRLPNETTTHHFTSIFSVNANPTTP